MHDLQIMIEVKDRSLTRWRLQGSLLKQLAIANKSVGGGVIVVLAERDKEEMEMDIAKLEFDFMGTSVICRSGSPLILADLKKVASVAFWLTSISTHSPSLNFRFIFLHFSFRSQFQMLGQLSY